MAHCLYLICSTFANNDNDGDDNNTENKNDNNDNNEGDDAAFVGLKMNVL